VKRPARASEAAQAASAGKPELTQCSRVASELTSLPLPPVLTCIGDEQEVTVAVGSFQQDGGIGTFMGRRSRQEVRGDSETDVELL